MKVMPEPGMRVVVRAAIAPLMGEPRISTSQISQRVSGHELEVLERGTGAADDWLRVRGRDAYEGWVHRGYLDRIEAFEPERRGMHVSLGCTVENARGMRRHLPLGARLWPDETVVGGATVAERERFERFPRERDRLIDSATELFAGAPYQWGGVTPWGADCSGFVQTIHELHGMPLPRDAWQQAQVGDALDSDPAALIPGDLAFFSDRPDGRITHVGIALGASGLVHSALGRGGWRVDEIGGAEPYQRRLRECYRFGRRLGSFRDG